MTMVQSLPLVELYLGCLHERVLGLTLYKQVHMVILHNKYKIELFDVILTIKFYHGKVLFFLNGILENSKAIAPKLP